MTQHGKRPSGSLLRFLRKLEQGLKQQNVDVPCNGCTACCRDPEFHVDLTVEETKRFPHVEMHGRFVLPRQVGGECINLIDGRCVVYADRPRTCRVYDCRYHLFGLPLAAECSIMREAVAQWEPFRLPTDEDKIAWAAIVVLVKMAAERDPGLSGLAYLLLQWKTFRPQAYELVQNVKRE